ncbi:MAG: zf-HC2 domain-containing protein, partial [Oscillospiraceae bacterium]|nr:zf-HC2 domain-containing protein [Oscillospiraceae bacterium]
MDIPCDLILDLLPLYQRGLCSENSEMIITEHLTGCDACYEILSKMDEKVDVPRYEQ